MSHLRLKQLLLSIFKWSLFRVSLLRGRHLESRFKFMLLVFRILMTSLKINLWFRPQLRIFRLLKIIKFSNFGKWRLQIKINPICNSLYWKLIFLKTWQWWVKDQQLCLRINQSSLKRQEEILQWQKSQWRHSLKILREMEVMKMLQMIVSTTKLLNPLEWMIRKHSLLKSKTKLNNSSLNYKQLKLNIKKIQNPLHQHINGKLLKMINPQKVDHLVLFNLL